MAIPPRGASALIMLSDGPDGDVKSDGSVFSGINVSSGPSEIYAYSHWFKNYPDEVIVKTHINSDNYVKTRIEFVPAVTLNSEYPVDIVSIYFPDPPDNDPVPDPNGENGTLADTDTWPSSLLPLDPRWHSETAINLQDSPLFSSVVPDTGVIYRYDSEMKPIFGSNTTDYSLSVSVENYESLVINGDTSELEFYPFKQATTTLNYERKIKVALYNTKICCWNKGTVIKGKIKFKKVNAIATPRSSTIHNGTPYGFGGINVEVGSSFSDAGDANWELTVEDDFDPPEVTIPKTLGYFTFINDHYVTEVIKPA